MESIIGVRVASQPKVQPFLADFDIKKNDFVVVETKLGLELGQVACLQHKAENVAQKIIRKATEGDLKKASANKEKAKDFSKKTKQMIKNLRLDMKLFDADLTLDEKKLIVYFTAEGRVDFRELVKQMAAAFKRRIELHQVGSRDEVQKLGSIGICGRKCCCGAFLTDFNHVSIKMAKVQGLSLMPNNITGACGKLLCCLEYENEEYVKIFNMMPPVNSTIKTPDGKGTVMFNNLVKKMVDV
ncbi:MAG: stage 0 sporulation protein, partial [Clostridia bacterium]|nr:stage 0 sporulation protein [Clostridia bacterium]